MLMFHNRGGGGRLELGAGYKINSSISPASHASRHENGGADEIDLAGLNGQEIILPKNVKIADITEADTNKHTLDLATGLAETRKIISILVFAYRMGGSGAFQGYPNEDTGSITLGSVTFPVEVVIKDGTQRLQYNQTVANDDWDIYCCGYKVVA